MFTGIVEELGRVAAIQELPDNAIRITIEGPIVLSDANLGDSICVNGVCLTVAEQIGDVFTADVMSETINRTTIGDLLAGSQVNLERPVTLSTRLGGHLVQGHVDAVGTVSAREHSENWDVVTITPPKDLLKYVVEKGSITIDGTSLTVSAVTDSTFSVSLIPATLEKTTLGIRQIGDRVNLEVDVLAKYVEKLVAAR
ncbi:MAG: riboflavin synthase [Actinobacteria bacterium]|jgi:riboflavin synthase|nr:riboflavin synthase [Actinomycetota bacterium]